MAPSSTNNFHFTCYYCRWSRRRVQRPAGCMHMQAAWTTSAKQGIWNDSAWCWSGGGWANESEKGLVGWMLMLPPGKRSAGTYRSAWRGGSSSSRTCAGGGKQQQREESGTGARRGSRAEGNRRRRRVNVKKRKITSCARPCGGRGKLSRMRPGRSAPPPRTAPSPAPSLVRLWLSLSTWKRRRRRKKKKWRGLVYCGRCENWRPGCAVCVRKGERSPSVE